MLSSVPGKSQLTPLVTLRSLTPWRSLNTFWNWTLLSGNKFSLLTVYETTWSVPTRVVSYCGGNCYWRIHISQGLIGSRVFEMENRVFQAPRSASLPTCATSHTQIVTLHHRLFTAFITRSINNYVSKVLCHPILCIQYY